MLGANFLLLLCIVCVQGVPFILVGTKVDLRNDAKAIRSLAERRQQPISFSEAQNLANELGAYRYLECSALTQQGLKHVFDGAIRCVLEQNQKQKKKKKKKSFCLIA
jgi:Ras-related C3 botulinum toxin substrate 1